MDEEQRQNVYYLAISGCQKAVRRGELEVALRLGRVGHYINPWGFSQRIWTMLFEDCARDEYTLKFFNGWKGDIKKWESVEPLLRALVGSMKTRDGTCVSWFIKYAREPKEYEETSFFREFQIDGKYGQFHKLLELQDKWPRYEFDAYDHHDFLFEDDWVLEFCRRGEKMHRERLSRGVPLLYMKGCKEIPLKVVSRANDFTLLRDVLPLCAIDVHTRPGSFAHAIVWKKVREDSLEMGINQEDFRWFVFLNDGGLYNNHAIYPTDFTYLWDRGQGITSLMLTESAKTFFVKRVKPELDGLREWVFEKVDQFKGIDLVIEKMAIALEKSTV